MARFITILLAESAIEAFPEELLKNIEIRKYLQKIKKKPENIMLDASYHKNFMKNLADSEKRGRPDIVHFALLSCFGSIIAREGRLRVLIHTYDDKIIELQSETRLPKNLDRFNGIFLQLFKEKQIPPNSSDPLMKLSEGSLDNLVKKLRKEHDQIIEFTVEGKKLTTREYSEILHTHSVNPLLIFGAFPHGHLTRFSKDLVDHRISIYEEGLDLFAVIAQILSSLHALEENSKKSSDVEISWE